MESKIECNCINQMFEKNYVLLSGEELNVFVSWIFKLRGEFENIGSECIEQLFHECVGNQELEENTLLESNNVPVLNQLPERVKTDALQVEVMLESTVVEEIPETLDYYGEFYLELNEWKSI